jgi:hypothetical protein
VEPVSSSSKLTTGRLEKLAAVPCCVNLVREDVIRRSDGAAGIFRHREAACGVVGEGRSLEAIAALVPWESFRADIEAVVLTPEEAKKIKAGRKPFPAAAGCTR